MYRCIRCGLEVKEGRQICPACELKKRKKKEKALLREDDYYAKKVLKETRKVAKREVLVSILNRIDNECYSTEALNRLKAIIEDELFKVL